MVEDSPSLRTSLSIDAPKAARGGRLSALDAFRGLTILLMVLVNDVGEGSYGQLQHAEWHGMTLTDTVFPSFLWIVGVAITLSLTKRLGTGVSRTSLLPSILRRFAILYGLGLFSYLFPRFDFTHARFLGVLQRIAICYLIVSVLYLWTTVRQQVLFAVGVIALYIGLMYFAPVPGYGAGHWDVERNFAHYIDSTVLGIHNYRQTKTWDPEGIVSTLPAIATTILGVMAGHILRLKKSLENRIIWLFVMGSGLLLTGLFWSAWLPLNKKLWTPPYALVMGGIDSLVLGCFLWFADALDQANKLKPLLIVGMNSIAVYMASELTAILFSMTGAEDWFTQTLLRPNLSTVNASLAWGLLFTGLMYLVAYALYRRKWFLRV